MRMTLNMYGIFTKHTMYIKCIHTIKTKYNPETQ